MKKSFLLVVFVLFSLSLFSQKSEYFRNFTEGNLLVMEKNYGMGLDSYLKAYSIDSTNANINYKIGLCYMNIPSKKKMALPYMAKASADISRSYDEDESHEKSAPLDALFYHARALHLSEKFNEAITEFEKYKSLLNSKNKSRIEEVDKQLAYCRNAIEFYKKPEDIVIKHLGDSVNSEYPDYGPVVNADETVLMFTSRRPGSTGGELSVDGHYFEDIYLSKRKDDGSWSSPQHSILGINSSSNEATIGLSPDGQRVYIYKDDNGGDIFYSELQGEIWSPPIAFGSDLNSPHWETHVTFSTDTSAMYFSSDRPGGYGGLDIYRCTKLPNGKWAKPYNLGPVINTKYNEDAPYLHPDGKKMFFSSEGHNSIGGFDIFYSTISINDTGNVTCSAPVSLRVPVNTPDDDEFYVPTASGIHAYFSSSRDGGFGDQDIYVADLPSDIQVDPLVLLKGLVTFGTAERPDKVDISVFDAKTKEMIALCKPNAVTGKYLIILNPGPLGKKYIAKYEAKGYQPIVQTFDVLPGSAYQVIEKEVELDFINMEAKAAGTISLGGTIKNEEGEAIVDVEIKVKDNNTGALIGTYSTSSDIGYYYIMLECGKNYNISFEAPEHLFQSQNIDVPKKTQTGEMFKNIVLEKIHKGAKMVMNNIFFDKNKSTLRKQSTVELATVQKMLKEHPDMVIEISGHTDSQGNDAANEKLSLARAQSVVTHLIKQGIPKKQLIAKGYGETQPIAPNTLPDGKPDLKGMQQNRRVEMKILN
ncbi:MAG: OmpA family protein [Bacteroidia bacterium]